MKRAGFTLLEVLVVMVMLSLIASGYYGPQLLAETRRIKRIQADVVAQEISAVGAAAQAYVLAHAGSGAGSWPREEHDCRQAHLALTDRLPPHAFSRDTAFYRGPADGGALTQAGGVAWHIGRYYFGCIRNSEDDPSIFRVYLMFDIGDDGAALADYVANQLPGSSVTFYANFPILTVEWPLPAALPAFDAFVAKAEPELEGHLDVNGHSIFDADEVILNSGQTLASALQYAGLARPGNEVNKPDCPPGLTPQVVTVPVEMGHNRGQPLTHFRVFADDAGTAWRVNSTVHGVQHQSFTDDSRVRVAVFTMCS